MPTSSVGKSFTVAKISRIEKVWLRGGSIKFLRRKIFVSQCRKFSVGESLTVAIISVIEKVCIGGGSIKVFHRDFSVS